EGLGRQSALDQPRGSRRLDDSGDFIGAGLLSCPAGVIRPPCHGHVTLGRDLVETLADVLADRMQLAPAARTRLALRLDHHLLMWQMIELLLARWGGPPSSRRR